MTLDMPTAPAADPTLRERVQVSDAVVRARMTSQSQKVEDTGTTYTVTLQPVEVIAGKNAGSEFTVSFANNSPSAGILKNRADDLVTKRTSFVAFLRTFAARADGDPELHFHFAPDTTEVVKAVRDAAAQQELR
jgi:hypothetical protein